MKLKLPKMNQVLKDKNVLYMVFVLAILNILGYLLLGKTEAVLFFLIVGFLSSYFSKNMIVVLMIAIISTSLFTATRTTVVPMLKEGMSSRREDKKETRENKKEEIKEKINEEVNQQENANNTTAEEETTIEEISTISNNKKNRIDYAGTLEEAYKNLKKTVGEGGIEGLTQQTETLLNQQKELMDNITGMQPFLKTAESFMNKLDFGSLEGLGGMLSKLGANKK